MNRYEVWIEGDSMIAASDDSYWAQYIAAAVAARLGRSTFVRDTETGAERRGRP